MSEAEDVLALHCKVNKIEFQREYKFHPTRKWRADFFMGHMLLVEIEGGIFVNGRHSRGAGMEADMEKYNAAQELGYTVLRFSSGMVKNGSAIAMVQRFIQARKHEH